MLAAAAALFVFAFALYARSLSYGFVAYDDERIVLQHPQLYGGGLAAGLRQIFVADFPREEPLLLRDVSWLLNARLFGFENPFGYHLGNVLANATAVALLFLFLLEATRRVRLALPVAAAFAALPVHVEPVCWVMGRKDVLCACFVLLALWLEARAQHAEAARRRRLWRALAFVCCPLAILSKFSAISLWLVIAVYRVLAPYLDGRAAPSQPLDWRRAGREVAGVLPHLLVSLALFLWYRRILAAWGIVAGGGRMPPMTEHLATLARLLPLVIGLYVKSVFAASQHSISYLWPHVSIPLTALERAASVGVAVALAAGLAWGGLRRRDLLFYLLAFLALLAPYFNLVETIIWRADRYVYVASFCVVAVVVQAADELLAKASTRTVRAAGAAAAAAWTLMISAVTWAREPAFRDNHALWSYEVSLDHPSILAYEALAKSYLKMATAETDPARRMRLLDEVDGVVTAGEAYYRSVPWRVAPGYHFAQALEYADLLVQRGRASAVRGAPLPVQIAQYRRSYEAAPTRRNTVLLAGALFDLAAATHDEAMARESLRYYTEYVVDVTREPARSAQVKQVLDGQYARVFPALAPALAEIERRYLR